MDFNTKKHVDTCPSTPLFVPFKKIPFVCFEDQLPPILQNPPTTQPSPLNPNHLTPPTPSYTPSLSSPCLSGIHQTILHVFHWLWERWCASLQLQNVKAWGRDADRVDSIWGDFNGNEHGVEGSRLFLNRNRCENPVNKMWKKSSGFMIESTYGNEITNCLLFPWRNNVVLFWFQGRRLWLV